MFTVKTLSDLFRTLQMSHQVIFIVIHQLNFFSCLSRQIFHFLCWVHKGKKFLLGHAYHCWKILLSHWAMSEVEMNTWAMNIILEVIKGYLRNITSSKTPEETFLLPSIRLKSGPMEEHQEADMSESCTLNQSLRLKSWHLIKSDPDLTEVVTAYCMHFSGEPDFLWVWKWSWLDMACPSLCCVYHVCLCVWVTLLSSKARAGNWSAQVSPVKLNNGGQ